MHKRRHIETRAVDRHGAVAGRLAERVGHGGGELRGQQVEAGGILVVEPVEGLDDVGVEEGLAGRDADGQVDDDGVLGLGERGRGLAGRGPVAEDVREVLLHAEEGAHTDAVRLVVDWRRDLEGGVDAVIQRLGDGHDRAVEVRAGDGLRQVAAQDEGVQVLDAVLQSALCGPGIGDSGSREQGRCAQVLCFGAHEVQSHYR